jgi:raw score 6.86
VAQPSTPNTQSGNTNRALTDKHAGFVIPKKGGTIQTASISGNPNLYVLDVEGKSINIIPTGMGAGKVLKITANNITRIVNGSLYKNVRWGLITEDGLNNYYLVSYGINPTTNMPTSGSATYVGQGVHGYADSGSAIDTYRLSNAKFNVNFADKSFEGSITPDDGKAFGNINAVKLSAKIDGNQFNGKTAEGTEAVGRFYGNNASELAGSYVNEKASYLGVFGAQKQ